MLKFAIYFIQFFLFFSTSCWTIFRSVSLSLVYLQLFRFVFVGFFFYVFISLPFYHFSKSSKTFSFRSFVRFHSSGAVVLNYTILRNWMKENRFAWTFIRLFTTFKFSFYSKKSENSKFSSSFVLFFFLTFSLPLYRSAFGLCATWQKALWVALKKAFTVKLN